MTAAIGMPYWEPSFATVEAAPPCVGSMGTGGAKTPNGSTAFSASSGSSLQNKPPPPGPPPTADIVSGLHEGEDTGAAPDIEATADPDRGCYSSTRAPCHPSPYMCPVTRLTSHSKTPDRSVTKETCEACMISLISLDPCSVHTEYSLARTALASPPPFSPIQTCFVSATMRPIVFCSLMIHASRQLDIFSPSR